MRHFYDVAGAPARPALSDPSWGLFAWLVEVLLVVAREDGSDKPVERDVRASSSSVPLH